MMPVSPPDCFTLPRLILVEGQDDVAFFRGLIDKRNLHKCHVRHSGRPRGSAGGNSKFGERLAGLRLAPGFGKLKHVLVVSDSDDDPHSSFITVRSQLSAQGFDVPDNPNSQGVGKPSLTIVTIPFGEVGTLESICIASARSADQTLAAHVDRFVDIVTS